MLAAVSTRLRIISPTGFVQANKSPWVENTHKRYRSLGLIQNVYVNLEKEHYVEAGLWYQHKTMEIPVLMGSMKTAMQIRKTAFSGRFLPSGKLTEKYALVVRSAYLSDYLNYRDKN